jgi:hypothetical protein
VNEVTREVDVWAEDLDISLATPLSEDLHINVPVAISEVDTDDHR